MALSCMAWRRREVVQPKRVRPDQNALSGGPHRNRQSSRNGAGCRELQPGRSLPGWGSRRPVRRRRWPRNHSPGHVWQPAPAGAGWRCRPSGAGEAPLPRAPAWFFAEPGAAQPGLAACVSAWTRLKPEAVYLACLRDCLQPHPRGCNRQLWALSVPQTSQHGASRCPRTLGHQLGQGAACAPVRVVHAPPPAAATCTALLRLLPDPGRCPSGRAALPRLPPSPCTSLTCRRTLVKVSRPEMCTTSSFCTLLLLSLPQLLLCHSAPACDACLLDLHGCLSPAGGLMASTNPRKLCLANSLQQQRDLVLSLEKSPSGRI